MTKWIAKNLGVDAGMIMIADSDYFEKGTKSNLYSYIDLDEGNYNVYWQIKNTWNGDIEGVERLEVPSGRIIIADPCYLIPNDKWDDWLEDTAYGRKVEGNAFIVDGMGGDGVYDFEFSVKKLVKKEK